MNNKSIRQWKRVEDEWGNLLCLEDAGFERYDNENIENLYFGILDPEDKYCLKCDSKVVEVKREIGCYDVACNDGEEATIKEVMCTSKVYTKCPNCGEHGSINYEV